jgi:hypothetical protein
MADPILELAVDLNGPSKALQFVHPLTGEMRLGTLVSGTTNRYKVELPGVILPSPYPFKLRVNGKLVTIVADILDLRPPVDPTEPVDPEALPFTAATSAGVYEKETSRQVATLWSNEVRPAGDIVLEWDGNDDMGVAVTTDRSLLEYRIGFYEAAKPPTWLGLVGNTSPQSKTESTPFTIDSPSGQVEASTVHIGFRPFAGFSIHPGDNVARFSTGQTEGPQSTGKFLLTDIQKKISEQLPIPAANRLTQGTCYIDQDATLAWHLGYDGIDSDNHGDYYSRWFLYAINRSTGQRVTLPGGVNYTIQQGGQPRGITYSSYSFTGRCSGLAVQKSGNFIFVSLPDTNEVIRINKTTGARVSLPFTRPGALLVDREDRLWVASQSPANLSTTASKLPGQPVSSVSFGADQQFKAANAFDGNPNTYFASSTGVSQGWAGLYFATPKVITRVRLFPSGGREADCKGWIQLSNANFNDEARDRRTVQEINTAPAANQFTDYSFTNTRAYSYARVWNPAGAFKVQEMEVWGYDPLDTPVVASYTIGTDGSLTATGVTLSGHQEPTALADDASGNLWVREGGTKQALCRYTKANGGAATLTLTGSEGVKFYFTDLFGNLLYNQESPAPLACQNDGSIWVGDTGNARLLHLSATGAYIEHIGYLSNTRNCQGDANSITRLFDNLREFTLNHALELSPTNGSWKLAFNWGQTYNGQILGKLREISTLSNGRTYAVVAHEEFPGAPSRHVVELVQGVGVRDTGVLLPQGTQFTENGDVYRYVYDVGVQAKIYRRALTGFDASGNPQFAAEVLASSGPTPVNTDPHLTNIRRHPSGVLVVHDGLRSGVQLKESGEVLRGEGGGSPFYHLGGWQEGQTQWAWRTSRTTDANYNGPFPLTGPFGFDSGNGVNQADGPLLLMVDKTSKPRRLGAWVYAGEFYKGKQGCYIIVFDLDTGLIVCAFGSDAITNPPQMTSVVVAGAFVRVDDDRARIFVNEEGGRGLGCWEIYGLSKGGTIAKPAKPKPPTDPAPGVSRVYTDPFPDADWAEPTKTYSTAPRAYVKPSTWEAKAYFHNGNTPRNADGAFVLSGRAFRNIGDSTCVSIDVNCPVIVENNGFGGTPYQAYLSIRAPEITVRNNRAFGEKATSGMSYSPGVFLDIDNQNAAVTKLLVEHNFSTGCGGVRLQNINQNANKFYIQYNDFLDIDSVKGTGGRDFKSAIQLLNCPAIWIDIWRNQIRNRQGLGNGEDQINLYSCVGTAKKPVRAFQNLVDGAFSNNLSSGNNGFTGTGGTTDLSGGGKLVPAYGYVFDNQFIRTANAAFNIAGGHDMFCYHNRMVTYGFFEDGTTTIGQQSAAIAIFDYYQTGSANFYNNHSKNNLIGYLTWYKDRRDGSTNVLAADGKMLASDNKHMPDPITLASENYERQLWEQRKAGWLAADPTAVMGPLT